MNDVTAYLTDLGLGDISNQDLQMAAACRQYIPELNRNPDEKFYDYFYSTRIPEMEITWSEVQDRHNWDFKHQLLPLMKTWATRSWPDGAGTILDSGCGSGLDTCYLARSFPNKHFIGIDSSAPAIVHLEKRARRLGLSNVSSQIVDAFDLQSLEKGARCDAIVLNNVLDSSFPNVSAVGRRLKVAKKLLLPSGTVFLSLTPVRIKEGTVLSIMQSACRRAGFSIEEDGSFDYSHGPEEIHHLWWKVRALDQPPEKWWQLL
jgi:SAM-dependent methyltransferase